MLQAAIVLPSAVADCCCCAADGACCCGGSRHRPSEGVVLAGGGEVALVAGACKDGEDCVGGVLLQGGALLDGGPVLPKQVGGEGGVPVVLHLIVCLVEVPMEGALQASAESVSWVQQALVWPLWPPAMRLARDCLDKLHSAISPADVKNGCNVRKD